MNRLVVIYSFILSILMLSTGMVTGWWLHERMNSAALSMARKSENIPPAGTRYDDLFTLNINDYEHSYTSPEQAPADQGLFVQALNDNRIDDALVIYQQYERKGKKSLQPFRKNLEDWLSEHQEDRSIPILERFIHHYYQDEKLLTRLANSYEQQGKLEAAINALLDLKSFTISPEKLSSQSERIHNLSRTLYNQQLKVDQLHQILEVFQRLLSAEADYGFYRYALSQIYLAVGDNSSAIRELEILQTSSEFGRQAGQLLASLLPPPPLEEPEELPGGTVPLTSRDGHFIVNVSAGNRENVRLMIDTGASLTTLPSDLLSRLRRKKLAARVGHTQLKTAGGYQFAPIYQVKELHIGNFIVRDLQVAALDLYDLGSEGLLGMDVLGQFRFQLDQDRNTLTLQQR